ncbi:SRPBCC domain-containing protein [Candidatus Kaiserbacteria bacterium]|nr:SRPBCC domain-containing protein [Candidatus Kaiserbacteria bacterium]
MADVVLIITRTLDAKPEDVFKAWTDPKQVAEWYGPEGFANEVHEFDAREGGAYRLTMKGPNGEAHLLRGVFKTLRPPTKLVVTWQWQNGDTWGSETLVTVDFKPVGDKTEMTMTHSGFADEKQKEMHNQGWTSSFNKLAKLFA